MKIDIKYILAIAAIIIIIALWFVFSGSFVNYDDFAKCLTENGAIMYGTVWCGHCNNQKDMFGDSFSFINYVDCDEDPTTCQEAGVGGYPTWKIGGNNYPGQKPLTSLAELSGCQL